MLAGYLLASRYSSIHQAAKPSTIPKSDSNKKNLPTLSAFECVRVGKFNQEKLDAQYRSTVTFCSIVTGRFMPIAPIEPLISWSMVDLSTKPVLRSISEVPE